MSIEPKRTLMCLSPTMQSVNLGTVDKKGNRESLIFQPRQSIEVTESQFRSREVQKLLGAKFLTDVTAAHEKRAVREKEMGV